MEKNKNLKQFIQEELIKLHKITLLEEQKKQIESELKLLNEGVNTIELTFLKVDEGTGNFIYRGSDGHIYVSIEGVIHDVTDEREPDSPVHNTIIKQGEPIFNHEDRFGRNPGSKRQTEVVEEGCGAKVKSCVKDVKKAGDKKYNPYAVCKASIGGTSKK